MVDPARWRSGLAGLDLKAWGIPTLDEAVEQYCGLTGRSSLPNLDWYFAYNQFRLAGILQGIAGRVRDGTASSPQALAMSERVAPLAESALAFRAEGGRLREVYPPGAGLKVQNVIFMTLCLK